MCVRLFGCHAFVLLHYQYISLCKRIHIDVLSLSRNTMCLSRAEPALLFFYFATLCIAATISETIFFICFSFIAFHWCVCCMLLCVCRFAFSLSGYFHSIPQIILDTFFESHRDWTHFFPLPYLILKHSFSSACPGKWMAQLYSPRIFFPIPFRLHSASITGFKLIKLNVTSLSYV